MNEGRSSTATTGRHAGRTPPLEFTRRDWKPQFAAVVVPSLLYAAVTVFLLANVALAPGEGWWLRLLQLATVFGRGVIEQLGWVFGILITVQLGCLIAVLGGQIHARNRRDEADLRTALGLFSALPILGLSPALTVASIAAFRVGELRGALFVIVPAVALTIALSVFIGTFDVADALTKKELAKSDEDRALEHVAALDGPDDVRMLRTGLLRSLLLVLSVFVTAGVLYVLSAGMTLPPSWILWSFVVLILVSSTGTVFALGVVSASLKPALSATDLVMAGMLLIVIIAVHMIVVPTLFVLKWQFGVSALLAALILSVNAIRVVLEAREVRAKRVPAGFWRGGGGLARAGTAMARKTAEKERDDARERIESLEPEIDQRAAQEPKAKGRRRKADCIREDG